MIVKVNSKYHNKIMNYLNKEPEINFFIIGDIEKYGYDNYFFDVWADISKNGSIEGILVKYFEFIMFYSYCRFDVNKFANLINRLDYTEISGKLECLEKLADKIDTKRKRIVSFCTLKNSEKIRLTSNDIKIKKIRFGNINKVAKLYGVIDEFENTSVESIKNGLKSGRGYCIEVNKQIVAMAKSTLENNQYALIVGVGTHPNYRNRGYATICIKKICSELINENKVPCLFYDNEEAGKIYRKLGFREIGKWAIYYT